MHFPTIESPKVGPPDPVLTRFIYNSYNSGEIRTVRHLFSAIFVGPRSLLERSHLPGVQGAASNLRPHESGHVESFKHTACFKGDYCKRLNVPYIGCVLPK